jgi:hypothetical protein
MRLISCRYLGRLTWYSRMYDASAAESLLDLAYTVDEAALRHGAGVEE